MKPPLVASRIVAAAVAVAVVAVAVAVATAGTARAASGPAGSNAADHGPGLAASRLDVQARDLFQGHSYAEALAIYQRLYSETHHPTYLRNVGRCHQMLRQPAPAIDAFRAYLRDARDLGQPERTEIEGYIAEMQRLEVSAPSPSSAATPGAPNAAAGSQPTIISATPAPAPASEQQKPITRKWWFWAGLGVLAVTAGIVAVAATSGGQDRLPCPAGAICPP
jgi:hypothetical protein